VWLIVVRAQHHSQIQVMPAKKNDNPSMNKQCIQKLIMPHAALGSQAQDETVSRQRQLQQNSHAFPPASDSGSVRNGSIPMPVQTLNTQPTCSATECSSYVCDNSHGPSLACGSHTVCYLSGCAFQSKDPLAGLN
jgi:hypothetical protein